MVIARSAKLFAFTPKFAMMNVDRNQHVRIIANFGVIAESLLLAYELRLNMDAISLILPETIG